MSDTPTSHIINVSATQPRWRRMLDTVLTVAMWGAYLYLMQDFFHFLVTIYYWKVLHIARPDLPKAIGILHTMKIYVYIVVFNSILFLGWALYNQMRFFGKERRKLRASVTVKELAFLYRLPVEQINLLQRSRIMTLHHDTTGYIDHMELARDGVSFASPGENVRLSGMKSS
jgi:biofilm PGA synthesis protein PgaD